MKRKTTRLCAMCDKVIPDTYVVCYEHLNDYKKYKDEEWFKELVLSARRQFEIDNMEAVLGTARYIKPYQKLTDSEKQAIRFLRSKKLGAKSISKVLGISWQTIATYLYRLSNRKR